MASFHISNISFKNKHLVLKTANNKDDKYNKDQIYFGTKNVSSSWMISFSYRSWPFSLMYHREEPLMYHREVSFHSVKCYLCQNKPSKASIFTSVKKKVKI